MDIVMIYARDNENGTSSIVDFLARAQGYNKVSGKLLLFHPTLPAGEIDDVVSKANRIFDSVELKHVTYDTTPRRGEDFEAWKNRTYCTCFTFIGRDKLNPLCFIPFGFEPADNNWFTKIKKVWLAMSDSDSNVITSFEPQRDLCGYPDGPFLSTYKFVGSHSVFLARGAKNNPMERLWELHRKKIGEHHLPFKSPTQIAKYKANTVKYNAAKSQKLAESKKLQAVKEDAPIIVEEAVGEDTPPASGDTPPASEDTPPVLTTENVVSPSVKKTAKKKTAKKKTAKKKVAKKKVAKKAIHPSLAVEDKPFKPAPSFVTPSRPSDNVQSGGRVIETYPTTTPR